MSFDDSSRKATSFPVVDLDQDRTLNLRRIAEERLATAWSLDPRSVEHELLVRQAELEIQNEELRETERSLELSRREFFALYDLAPVGYLTVDHRGVIVRANVCAADQLASDRIRLPGRPLSSYLAVGSSSRFFEHLAQVVRTKQPVSCELTFAPPNASEFDCRITSSLAPATLTGDGEIFLTMVDITERMRAERALLDGKKRLRAIVDHTPLAITLLDEEDRIIETNGVFERFVELREPDVVGRPLHQFVVESDLRILSRLLSSDGRAVQPLLRLRPRALDVRVWMTTIEGATGRRPQKLVLMENVTETARAVERATLLESELRSVHQEKLQALGQLAGGVAHDFNNMLAAIMAFAETGLLEDSVPEDVRGDLNGIRDAALRARELVREVLTFARRRKPIRGPVHLDHLLTSSIKLVRGAAPSRIQFHYEGRVEALVHADEGQLQQAIVNLLTNAIQALGSNPGHIEIEVETSELTGLVRSDGSGMAPGVYWRIAIRDDGPGIEADVLDRIFEPFFTTREQRGGCGMGLATCQSIVELHGGLLEVSSEPGLGAEFRIFLPTFREETTSHPQLPTIPVEFNGRILFVDDEELVLRASRRLLVGLGAQVETFASPTAALKELRRTPSRYDVVFTDLTMPEMSGTDFAREINAVVPGLPIVLFTGNRGRLEPETLDDLQLTGIIEKPLSMREVSEVLGRLASTGSRRKG